jgi:uncharacterized protein
MRGYMLLAGTLLLCAYFAFGVLLVIVQDRFLLHPGKGPSLILLRATTHAYSIAQWIVDDKYRGLVATPPGPIKGTVLAFHGNAGVAGTSLYVADGLTSLGYRVILAEYPGFDLRPGRATVRNIVQAARDDLTNVAKTWHEPIVLAGVSFGAAVAAQVAKSQSNDSCGVLLITPWDSLATVARERFPQYPVQWMLHERMDSIDALRHYPRPIVVVGALRDEVLGIRGARHLFEQLQPNSEWFAMAAGHNDWQEASPAWPQWTARFGCNI